MLSTCQSSTSLSVPSLWFESESVTTAPNARHSTRNDAQNTSANTRTMRIAFAGIDLDVIRAPMRYLPFALPPLEEPFLDVSSTR